MSNFLLLCGVARSGDTSETTVEVLLSVMFGMIQPDLVISAERRLRIGR